MTIDQILARVHEHRPMSREQLFRHLRAFEIKPAGARQRPQQYPEDAAHRVLEELGFIQAAPVPQTQIVSMKTLRAVQRKARGK